MASNGSKIDMRKFEQQVRKALNEVESTAVMKAAGEFAVERIVKRTRLGRGVSSAGGTPEPLKPLSASYKDVRKGKLAFFTNEDGVRIPFKPDKQPNLAASTSAGKSNLTFTGQMLASIKVIAVRAGSVLIGPTGNRVGTRTKNRDVAGYVQQERPFLNLSKPEVAGLGKFLAEQLRAALKKALT